MDINLVPWLVAWTIVTLADVGVVLYRLKLTSHEVTGIRIEDTEADLPEIQEVLAHQLVKLDALVRWLSVVSVVMLAGITAVWLYQLFMKGY